MKIKTNLICIIIIILIISIFLIIDSQTKSNKEVIKENDNIKESKSMDHKLKITINNKELIFDLEDNKSVKALIDKLKEESIEINAKEYGGFEKVGDLGFTLPTDDKEIKTSPGDLVLYQGNQISLFYNENSWSYTKLGKVSNVSKNDLINILGKGDIKMTLSLYENNK